MSSEALMQLFDEERHQRNVVQALDILVKMTRIDKSLWSSEQNRQSTLILKMHCNGISNDCFQNFHSVQPWTLVIYQGLIYLLKEVKLAASQQAPGHFLSTDFW